MPVKNDKHHALRADLSPQGQALLELVADRVAAPAFLPGDPSTYLGYNECCVALGVAPSHADLAWGRLLQPNGLNGLNDWTKRHNLPRIIGPIVNQTGDRQYWPGGDYFASNGRPDMDGDWWEQQAREAAKFDWRPFQ